MYIHMGTSYGSYRPEAQPLLRRLRRPAQTGGVEVGGLRYKYLYLSIYVHMYMYIHI